jgi:hypothetical protein
MKKLNNVSFTAVNSGYYIVYVNDQQYSQHTTERVAQASATNALIEFPDADIYYKRDYTVNVTGRFANIEIEEENTIEEIEEDELTIGTETFNFTTQ